MAENKDKCAHATCSCSASRDSKYCSEYCKEAEDSGVIEIGCGCPHAACHQ